MNSTVLIQALASHVNISFIYRSMGMDHINGYKSCVQGAGCFTSMITQVHMAGLILRRLVTEVLQLLHLQHGTLALQCYLNEWGDLYR